jgi:hypothetical protein
MKQEGKTKLMFCQAPATCGSSFLSLVNAMKVEFDSSRALTIFKTNQRAPVSWKVRLFLEISPDFLQTCPKWNPTML